jgi:hypothetical protein
MLVVETRPTPELDRDGAVKGDRLLTLSSGSAAAPALDLDWFELAGFRDTTDCAELRPMSESDVGCTRRSMSSRWRLSSRAITRVMSRSVRAPTSAKVRAISSAALARPGDRVVSGPVTTTPDASPWSGMTRAPGWTTRDRCSLAKSSADTTFHPVRSISAILTRPVKSAAARWFVAARAPLSDGVTLRLPPFASAPARTLGSGVCRRPASPGATPSRGGITSPRGGRGCPLPGCDGYVG